MITKEEFDSLATLSRLEVKDEDYPRFSEELSLMVAFADEIGKLCMEDEESFGRADTQTALREDEVAPSAGAEEILSNAPCSQDGYFLLRKRA